MISYKIKLRRQNGAVLIVSLIMLLLLTLIGVTAMQTNGLEEKMAGNMLDRNIALQAAESALRDAERDISNTKKNAVPRVSGVSSFTVDCGKSTSTINDDGLCLCDFLNKTSSTLDNCDSKNNYKPPSTGSDADPTNRDLFKLVNKLDPAVDSGKPSVAYGQFTGVDPLGGGLSAQPRYIIEALNDMGDDCDSNSGNYCYRITVRAQGANPNTIVWLQSIFIP